MNVFISYRRKNWPSVHLLEEKLGRQIEGSLFVDYKSIDETNFERSILGHLSESDLMLVVVTQDTFAPDRIHHDDDWIRREIALALELNKPIIPILIDNYPLPSSTSLPENIRAITKMQAIECYQAYVDAAVDRLVAFMMKVVSSAQKRIEKSTAVSGGKRIWSVPYRRNPFFTGREDLLQTLDEYFTQATTAALTQPPAITGLGGIGKTQVAVEYAYRHKEAYHCIFWVNATSRETLLDGFASMATALALPVSDERDQTMLVAAVQHWLVDHGDWLLILDNADDASLIPAFLPKGGNGHILLTTRERVWGSIARSFTVEKMSQQEGILFLLRRAKVLTSAQTALAEVSRAQKASAAAIIQQMDGLPLALDQAGAYIEETLCSLESYLKTYQRQQTKLLLARGQDRTTHPTPVATTWALNFQQVKQESPTAAELLRLLAFLAPDAIPEEMIVAGAGELGPRLQALATDDTLLDVLMKVLTRFSLVQRNTDQHLLFIHRLVQAVLKASMAPKTQRTWAQRTVRAVNLAFPDVTNVELWAFCERQLPHALACAELITDYSLAIPEAASLLDETAHYLDDQARYEQAMPLFERALVIREQTLGPNHPQTAQSLNNLAELYRNQRDYEQAKSLYERALAVREQTLGPNHPQTAQSLNNLALLYRSQGDYKQARPLYERALAISEQALGPNHPQTATSLNNLAGLYKCQGDYEQARPLYERALVIMEKTPGPNHPNTKIVRANYASMLEGMNREFAFYSIAHLD